MKKCRIPQENGDIRRYAFWRNFKRIAAFLAYCGMWVLAYRYYLEYPISKPFVWWVLLIFASLVLISGWFLFSMTAFVKERNFFGKIESMKIHREFKKYTLGLDTADSADVELHRGLAVRDEKGKLRKLRFKMKDSGFGLYYREGGKIAYFRGTKFPISLEADEKGACMCVVCGTKSFPEWRDGVKGDKPTACSLCGRSLIDVEKLK